MPDSPASQPDPTPPVDRRAFFRRLILRGMDQVEQSSQDLLRQAQRFTGQPHVTPASPDPAEARESLDQYARAGEETHEPLRFLRPPGALPEPDFAAKCTRCDLCVQACPAQCIRLEPDVAEGLPFIVARESPCVVCEALACMAVCPTGALQITPREQIRMGLAVVDHDRCLRRPRSPDNAGDDCRLCIAQCPLGGMAIGLDVRGRIGVRPGCIGCGVCEHVCPTQPASIQIQIQDPFLPPMP